MIYPNFPLHRFEEFGPLSASELTALQALPGTPQVVKKGRTIREEGVAADRFFLLVSGWAAATHVVPDGGRQILKVHLPGDVLGSPSMCMVRTVEQLVALTDVAVVEVLFAAFGRLIIEHPRIGARFMLSVQSERVALMDRLVSMGRTSAEARTAALIIDLMERLKMLGLVEDNRFEMVLTQEHIGDVLGLTGVHVNRMMKVLTDQGYIERSERHLTVLNPAGLAALAAGARRKLAVEATWLPPAM